MDYKTSINEDQEQERSAHKDGGHTMYGKQCHFNPKELDVLDRASGGPVYIPGTDIRHYNTLEDNFKHNPELKKEIMEIYEHHAKGGHAGEMLREADEMRKHGRNGDSTTACIGPETEKVFNHLLGGGSVNPMTKMPEYFGLGRFMGNIGHHIKTGFNKAKNAVSNIGKRAAPIVNKAQDFMQSQHGQNMMQGAGKAVNAYTSGQGVRGALGAGVQGAAAGYNHPAARGLGEAAGSFGAGKGVRESVGRGVGAAAEGHENPMVRGAGIAARGLGEGQTMRNAASQGISAAAGGYDNSIGRGVKSAADSFGRGSSMQEAGQRGMGVMTKESQNPAVRGAGAMAQQYLHGKSAPQAVGAARRGMQRTQPQEQYSGANANDLYGQQDEQFA